MSRIGNAIRTHPWAFMTGLLCFVVDLVLAILWYWGSTGTDRYEPALIIFGLLTAAFLVAFGIPSWHELFGEKKEETPTIQIVSPGSYFGRFDSKSGRFALLLKVKFRNESEQPALIQQFRIQYAGIWSSPQLQTGNVTLYSSSRQFVNLLRSEDNLTVSPQIPAMKVIERYAFFLLPDPQDLFPDPGELHLTVEATFAHRNPRQITFTLTDQGEIKHGSEACNQETT